MNKQLIDDLQETARLLQKVTHNLLSEIDDLLKNKKIDLKSIISGTRPLASALERLGKLLANLTLLAKGYLPPDVKNAVPISAEDMELMRTLAEHTRRRNFVPNRIVLATPDGGCDDGRNVN